MDSGMMGGVREWTVGRWGDGRGEGVDSGTMGGVREWTVG